MNFLETRWFKILFVHRLRFVLLFLFVFLGVAAYLGQMLPKLMAQLFEGYKNEEEFFEILSSLGFVFFAEYLNRVLYQLSINKYVQHVILQTRNYCYRNWIKSFEVQKSGKKSKEYPLGEILARIMNDTEAIRELVTSGTFGIFIDGFFIISCLISFFTIDKFSGGFLILAEVVAIAFLIYASKYMTKAFLNVRKEVGLLSRSVADVTAGLFQSYYQINYKFGEKTVRKRFDSFLKEQLKANIYDASYYSVAESLYPLLLAFVGMVFSYAPLVAGAVVVAIIDLIQRSIDPIKDITGKISNLQRAYTGMLRINEFVAYLESGVQNSAITDFSAISLDYLKVKIIEFNYFNRKDMLIDGEEKGRPEITNTFEIRDLEFQAKSGELIGIVGLSGSGKSTLLKILSCDLMAKSGEINLVCKSGKSIAYDFEKPKTMFKYREQVSLVSQESHVFSETLQFNITLDYDEDLNQKFSKFWEKVKNEIEYVGKWGLGPEDFIEPKSLSLGQKQLISALRACFLKKPVALFDEISSGLDSDLELALRKLLLIIQTHSLTIIVAHRLETIIKADQILVMENGRLTAKGVHGELKDSSPVYKEFIDLLN